jgi:threonine synthase
VYAAWRTGAEMIDPATPGTTIAEGTRIGAPARQHQILTAIRASGGSAVEVSEDEIIAALKELWKQGLYVEPTAAVGAAAGIQAITAGEVDRDAEVVVLLTGSGLKATDTIARLIEQDSSGQSDPT